MNWRSGDMDRECLVSSGMGALMDGLYAGLNRTCMDQLSQINISMLSARIFKGKEELS